MKKRVLQRLEHTPLDNLVSNLRGEVGDIISTWTLLEDLDLARRANSSGDWRRDLSDQPLTAMSAICEKLADDIIVRLSELGQKKIGRLNFYFVSQKLSKFSDEVERFAHFVDKQRFTEKRNHDISHREMPERWDDHKILFIPFPTVLRGVALATILMKKVDQVYLGPSAPYLWREMRKQKRTLMMPLRAKYVLLPYMKLSPENRIAIIEEERLQGEIGWTLMPTKLNGIQTEVLVNRKWGAVKLGDRVVMLDQYPLNDFKSIDLS